MSIQAKLFDIIMRLPVEGPLYTAAYPLWCCFIAALASGYRDRTEKLYERLNSIRKRNKGVCPLSHDKASTAALTLPRTFALFYHVSPVCLGG